LSGREHRLRMESAQGKEKSHTSVLSYPLLCIIDICSTIICV
jgi:hypothetical protein